MAVGLKNNNSYLNKINFLNVLIQVYFRNSKFVEEILAF